MGSHGQSDVDLAAMARNASRAVNLGDRVFSSIFGRVWAIHGVYRTTQQRNSNQNIDFRNKLRT